MSDAFHRPALLRHPNNFIPVVMVRAMFAVFLVCLVLVSATRISGRPADLTPVVSEHLVVVSGQKANAVRVLDVNGSILANLSGEDAAFVLAMQEVIHQQRTKLSMPLDAPVLLHFAGDNSLFVTDPSTGWRSDLADVGGTNIHSFARLLDPK